MNNKQTAIISNLVLILIIVATFVYSDVDNEGTIWHHPFVWSSINWMDVLLYFLFLLLFIFPTILYVCGSWFENLSKPMQIVHSVFMLLGAGELCFLFYDNMQQYMGILPRLNLSEDAAFCIYVIPLLLICLYSFGVIVTRIVKWVINKLAQSIWKQSNAT